MGWPCRLYTLGDQRSLSGRTSRQLGPMTAIALNEISAWPEGFHGRIHVSVFRRRSLNDIDDDHRQQQPLSFKFEP